MKLIINKTKEELGKASAIHAAKLVNEAIAKQGYARILLSTGASQFPFFVEFVKQDIDWSKVEMFHLDEYVGISEEHPASFKRYLLDRFVNVVNPGKAHLINGQKNPEETIAELTALLNEKPVDVGLIGIGENAHIAFNDPPADFDTEEAYLVVDLDEVCRKQQLGEGWFPTFDDVPKQAISMSVRQIMKSACIINTVPDARKAYAVRITIEGELCPAHPASVIRLHPDCHTFCDKDSAADLSPFAKDLCSK